MRTWAVLCPTFGMCGTGVADEDGLFLDGVAALASGGTRIDCVAVVEATADRVPLHDLETHTR